MNGFATYRASRLYCLGLLLGLLQACNFGSDGFDPPRASLNFPVGLGLTAPSCDGAACALIVANANFNLRYNSGTVQSFDLPRVHQALAACNSGDAPCELESPADFLVSERNEVQVGSFAATLVLSKALDRVYVPMQSNGQVVVIEVDQAGHLNCGGEGDFPTCDDAHRSRYNKPVNGRDEKYSEDPIAVTTGSIAEDLNGPASDYQYLVMAHRSGRVSLLFEGVDQENLHKPVLVDVLSGLAINATNLAFDARNQIAYVTNGGQGRIERVGIRLGTAGDELSRAFLVNAGPLRVGGLDDGRDTRDLIFDPDPNSRRLYIATRAPEALISVDLSISETDPIEPLRILSAVKLGVGTSRAQRIDIGNPARTYVLVSCFDSRDLYVVDISLGEVKAVVRGFSGPFEQVFDAQRGVLYVSDFRASVIRILDMKPLLDNQAPRVVGILGMPRTVDEL